jgi:pilus assembly protein CpaE
VSGASNRGSPEGAAEVSLDSTRGSPEGAAKVSLASTRGSPEGAAEVSLTHTRGGPRRATESGQASVELLGVLPLLIALALAVFQLLAVGYASVLAGSAAEAGALALAAGGDPRAGVREALPGWSRARAEIHVSGGEVRVRLRPPALLRALAERLTVTGEGAVEAP